MLHGPKRKLYGFLRWTHTSRSATLSIMIADGVQGTLCVIKIIFPRLNPPCWAAWINFVQGSINFPVCGLGVVSDHAGQVVALEDG